MLTVFSPQQRLHNPTKEMHRGRFVPSFEAPHRVDCILDAVQAGGLGEVIEPDAFPLESLLATHSERYVEFLSGLHERWLQFGGDDEIVPHVWPARTLHNEEPTSIYGQLGYYSFDAGTTVCAGTWAAAFASACSAMTAAERTSQGGDTSFALCRPPGHHAARDVFGGYCFLNNAALAAERLRSGGADRVAVLDVDYHHGNGTQSIFYEREDVLFVSIHADPRVAYPYFAGHEHERGAAAGEFCNLNIPLPDGTAWQGYRQALLHATEAISDFGGNGLVISLGVDTAAGDPISTFALTRDDFHAMGAELATLGMPAVVVMEGGYDVSQIGDNVVSFLNGLNATSSSQ